MNPYIGITTSFEEGEQRLRHAYVRAVERAGGVPLIVPMVESPAAMASFAQLLDGLIITGGPAITEGLIGKLPTDISDTDPTRILADNLILNSIEEMQKPVLGICYGMQLLNARAGGTIYADVQTQVSNALVHSVRRGADEHDIEIDGSSALFAALQTQYLKVNTRHIQALARIGAGFSVTAEAPDGVPEAIENESGSIIGVQFHPEEMGETMLPLFKQFVERARETRLEKASSL